MGDYGMLKVSKDTYVRKALVERISAYEGGVVKNFVRLAKLRGDGTVINCTGGRAIACVVVLTTGSVYLTSVSAQTVCSRMEQDGAPAGELSRESARPRGGKGARK